MCIHSLIYARIEFASALEAEMDKIALQNTVRRIRSLSICQVSSIPSTPNQ